MFPETIKERILALMTDGKERTHAEIREALGKKHSLSRQLLYLIRYGDLERRKVTGVPMPPYYIYKITEQGRKKVDYLKKKREKGEGKRKGEENKLVVLKKERDEARKELKKFKKSIKLFKKYMSEGKLEKGKKILNQLPLDETYSGKS